MKRLMIFLVLMLAAAAPANAQCLSQAQAREAVASGKAKPLASVTSGIQGKLLDAPLCVQGGRYVYQLKILVNGQVVTQTVNASR